MTLPSSRQPVALSANGASLPLLAGAGFKLDHTDAWLADGDAPAFAEVHAENFMGAGGMPHAALARLREHRSLSVHGVGLSLGAQAPLDAAHLERVAAVLDRYQPQLFSEHLAWSTHGGRFFGDLLPLAYDASTLDRVCAHVDQIQQRLRRRLLLENPSTYFEFAASTMSEPEFIAAIVARTGCGLLLDLTNVQVSCHNNRRDPLAYLAGLPLAAVGEIHLAGCAEEAGDDGATLLIDNHGAAVAKEVWDLYAHVLAHTGPVATLIEWDSAVPAYPRLRAEARRAGRLLAVARDAHAAMAA